MDDASADGEGLADGAHPGAVARDLLPRLVGYQLRRVQVAVFDDFSKSLAGDGGGITPGQFGVMVLIGANPGLTQTALARAVGIERSTMVAVLDGLEQRGLVERRRGVTDRRSHALVLTPAGEQQLTGWKASVEAHDLRMTQALSAAERAELLRLLARIAPPEG